MSPHGAGGVLPLAGLPRSNGWAHGPNPPAPPTVSTEYDYGDESDDPDGLTDDAAELDDLTPGTKKRKGPVPVVPGSEADVDSGRDGLDRNPPRSAREDNEGTPRVPVRRLPRSSGATLAAQRRALFHKRKGVLVALYCAAQAAYDAANPRPLTPTSATSTDKKDANISSKSGSKGKKDTSGNTSPTKSGTASPVTATPTASRSGLPDVAAFERLLPALEDVVVWPPDAPSWREGDDAARPVPRRSLERWRTGFARRKRQRTDRVPVHRGGWIPEGSFELDISCEASTRARNRARERVALLRLAEQLRALVLACNKIPSASEPVSPPPTPPATESPAQKPPLSPKKNTKKKKKKRTTLANEGNPHHVDKYRPSRPIPTTNPYEPWPGHASLLFPPSMRVLAARPGGKDQRPGEDEYICWSCQYSLFYGPEALRKQAVRQRRAELKRREKLKARAREVATGTRPYRPGGDDDDDDYDDEEDEEDDDDDVCEGRCSCGRALPKCEEDKPPDKDAGG
ncbi:hypothetical protein CcaverHIS002_0312010 [Cutaneotrichosporon cavernicola]|uniref:Uncharacterized protein n=1 Tax=Cutaneotrichosporon cavernicola TaxID=279322 RepID=A0AA48L379_9TREE|nr:uncharacterized protein CcaverHIS019_0311870 [Cutaneotrichosporon cavernicola]BEI83333.1 hypothetical protein CcaverHIS002_0312010 [Cutaneotrichosporon cavernicola]BEI91117.1 hypothetical protein CcaverHIS019_0311870 [Cutaneotrichosporon cavernicola]BEI98894.1 hypothetical protein CcaverHIS631_0311930 [Cutaneotrichosporon cavernicola]BEJ06667.1 hypothetical protein CcaverHIS641_0311890 [Cutaneotrichosporon cavernicola]